MERDERHIFLSFFVIRVDMAAMNHISPCVRKQLIQATRFAYLRIDANHRPGVP